MKKVIVCSVALGLILSVQSFGQSVVRQLMAKNILLLGCYKYDNYALNQFVVGKQGKKIETDFLAGEGLPSKIVFCQNGIYNSVLIEVFDGSKTSKKRKKVYDNFRSTNQASWMFEPKKSGRYYVEYTIPSSETDQKAYILMIQGCDYGNCKQAGQAVAQGN